MTSKVGCFNVITVTTVQILSLPFTVTKSNISRPLVIHVRTAMRALIEPEP